MRRVEKLAPEESNLGLEATDARSTWPQRHADECLVLAIIEIEYGWDRGSTCSISCSSHLPQKGVPMVASSPPSMVAWRLQVGQRQNVVPMGMGMIVFLSPS